jgi:hypothetical protein
VGSRLLARIFATQDCLPRYLRAALAPTNLREHFVALKTAGYCLLNSVSAFWDAPKWFLGLLNSNSVEWFYGCVANRIRGGYLRAFSDYMQQIPIPVATSEKQKAMERLVDRILAAKQRDAEADVSALEREIDQLVYALYGLTPEEIQIVEGAAK